MGNIDLNEYKNKLEIELKRLTDELNELGVQNPETGDWLEKNSDENIAETDLNTEADEAEAWEERSSTLSDLEIEYRDVKRALQKITDGTFGICEISQEPIEENRLNFKPTARTCIKHMNDESQLPL